MSIQKGLDQYGNIYICLIKSFFDILKRQKIIFITLVLWAINSTFWAIIDLKTYPFRN